MMTSVLFRSARTIAVAGTTALTFACAEGEHPSLAVRDPARRDHVSHTARVERPVDSRVWSLSYWQALVNAGRAEPAPRVAPAPAARRESTFSLLATTDTPDVAVTSQTDTTQSENSVFVSPLDSQVVLNANNSTDWVNGAATTLYGADAFWSTNRGASWQGSVKGIGGSNAGDPAAAIALSGWFYVGHIAPDYGQRVNISNDGGTTWKSVEVASADGASVLDKNHLWVDNGPASPYSGHLYAAWTTFDGAADAQIEAARSTNLGESWSARTVVSAAAAAGSHNQGVNCNTHPEGELYCVWAIYDTWPSDETALGFARSTDGGATWQPAKRIITNIRGIRTTGTSKDMRVNSFPVMAVDPAGRLHVVWANLGVPGINSGPGIQIYVATSFDRGDTWSTPAQVNQDARSLGRENFLPWITADRKTGELHVIFLSDRNVTSTEVETFVATSSDGGATWRDFRVSDVAFTPQPIAGLASGYFGDYLGISALGGRVYPVWTDNRLGRALAFTSPFDSTPPEPDFSLVMDPSSVLVAQGESGASTCLVRSLSGFANAVTLGCAKPPAGVTCAFAPNTVTPPADGDAKSTLTLSVAATAVVGTYTVQVQGTSGGVLHATQLALKVTSSDFILPNITITSPANGSTVSGLVTVSADASDDRGIDRVEIFANGALLTVDPTPPYEAAWDTLAGSNGLVTLLARAFDVGGNSREASVQVEVRNAGEAAYDPMRQAPACYDSAARCDSAQLLVGRDGVYPEPHAPNTIYSSCADGSSGIYHADESLDHIRVRTKDGGPLRPGAEVVADFTVWAYSEYTSDWLHVYHAANAGDPVWQPVGSIVSVKPGEQVLSVSFTLPEGNLQAVRGVYAYDTRATPCLIGGFNDHDDLVFATGGALPPPTPTYTLAATPAELTVQRGATASYTVTVTPFAGFNGKVTFSAGGLPSGVSASFAPTAVVGSGSSLLSITTKKNTARGSYAVTISGTSATVARSVIVILTVTS